MTADEDKAALVDHLRMMECRGEFVLTIRHGTKRERGMVSVFLESRRLGRVPPFSRQWCIDHGVVPLGVLEKSEERPS